MRHKHIDVIINSLLLQLSPLFMHAAAMFDFEVVAGEVPLTFLFRNLTPGGIPLDFS